MIRNNLIAHISHIAMFTGLIFIMWMMAAATTPMSELLAQAPTATVDSSNNAQAKAMADTLFWEGNELYEQGDLQDALKRFLEASTIYRRLGHKEDLAICYGFIGNIYLNLNDSENALSYFQEAWPIFQEIGFKEGEMAMYVAMASIYESLARYREALEFYQKTLPLAQELEDPNFVGGVYYNLGLNYRRLSQYQRALEAYQGALSIVQEKTHEPAGEAKLYNEIGIVYADLGAYAEALQYFHQALSLHQELSSPLGKATSYNYIAGVQRVLGNYQEALSNYQRARDLAQRAGAGPLESVVLNNMGSVYSLLGDDETALEYQRLALAVATAIDYKEGMATAANNIGRVQLLERNYTEALKHFQDALRIFELLDSPVGQAAANDNIGQVYFHLSRYYEALQNHQRALAIRLEIGDRRGVAVSYGGIGLVYTRLGNYEEALKAYDAALMIAREIGYRSGEAAALNNIGFVYDQLGDSAQAIIFYQQAIDVTESIQSDINIEELKTSFGGGPQADTYERLINLLWQRGRFDAAYDYVERARARAFLDQLANGRVNFRTRAAPELLDREQALKTRIAARRAQLVTFHNPPRDKWDTEAIAAAQTELKALEKEYTDLLLELKIQSPEVAALVSVNVATLEEIQTLLDSNTTLVEYFVMEERTLVFLITRDSLEAVELQVRREELLKQANSFRQPIDAVTSIDARAGRQIAQTEVQTALEELYRSLIAPLSASLNTPRLAIVPHSVLHYLPFAALTDGERYLSDDYALFTLPSASVLRFLQEKQKPDAGTLLALGNPTTAAGLPNLDFAEQEVKQIADLSGAKALVGADATEQAVWSQAGEASILHLAAHGEYNPDNPLFSVLHLAGDDQYDGRLEVHEIYELDLTAATNLVVLSACQTQLGELSTGDEVVALNRAFLYAGTPSVIASLWNVDDAATALLMERFYTHLQAGMGKAEALRQAQIDVRAREEYRHPYYWAAFVLSGDGGDLSDMRLQTSDADTTEPIKEVALERHSWTWLIVGGGLLIIIVIGRVLWRWSART